jgi:predicted tellurium resistance membrane protein TerC
MIKLIEYLQTRMKTVVMVCYVLLILIAAFAAIVDKHHAHTWVEQNIPFFWSIFGFCAAALLIGVARWLGKAGIQVPENYYEQSIWLDDSEK